MENREKLVLNKLKGLLLKKIGLNSLVLFGSRARGNADPYSDMDVLVVVDRLDKEIEDYISDCAWEAGFEEGIVILPIIFTKDEWEKGSERFSLLAQAIRSEGVSL
ncbi:MAG: nucleotidyltransferase domain-containing protein [Thermodesulfobacteriota bacterium]|nr:nucleotidyltransferase domain-containing protein [Thermodesulfobacteriota bacterium]